MSATTSPEPTVEDRVRARIGSRGVKALQRAVAVEAKLDALEQTLRERRRLMLAAQRHGVQVQELADAFGHVKSWAIEQLRQAREEEAEQARTA